MLSHAQGRHTSTRTRTPSPKCWRDKNSPGNSQSKFQSNQPVLLFSPLHLPTLAIVNAAPFCMSPHRHPCPLIASRRGVGTDAHPSSHRAFSFSPPFSLFHALIPGLEFVMTIPFAAFPFTNIAHGTLFSPCHHPPCPHLTSCCHSPTSPDLPLSPGTWLRISRRNPGNSSFFIILLSALLRCGQTVFVFTLQDLNTPPSSQPLA